MEIRDQLLRSKRMRTHPSKCNPSKFCLYHRVTITIWKSASSSKMKSRSSSGAVGLVGSYDVGRKNERIDREHPHHQNHRGTRSSEKIDPRSVSLTPSLEDFSEERLAGQPSSGKGKESKSPSLSPMRMLKESNFRTTMRL